MSDPEAIISINTKWCGLIASGKKTIEVKKTRPINAPLPIKCYIYECGVGGSHKVIGEFTCKSIMCIRPGALTFDHEFVRHSCLSLKQLLDYTPKKPFPKDCVHGWCIKDLKLYDTPKALSEYGLNRPPQSWCYVLENEVRK